MRVLHALVILLLLVAPGSRAETLFINDATVHTMGIRAVMQDTDILIRDGLVQALGADLTAPADAVVIEADGKPVTPGLFAGISAHGLTEIGAVEHTVDSTLKGAGMRPEFDVTPAYNPLSSVVEVTRIEGITWALLGAAQEKSIIGGQGQVVSLNGKFDAFRGAKVLFVSIGGPVSGKSGSSRAAQWMLLEQAIAETRKESAASAPEPLLTPAGREVFRTYLDGGIVVFDANRASDILQVLAFSEKHDLQTVINGAAEGWYVADQLAEAGVPVLLNPLSNRPADFDQLGARLDNAALLHEAGVSVIISGAGTHNARKQRQLAGNAVAHGLPWEAALAALTVQPAIVFGLAGGSGTIEPGSPADIVIWSGDPLEVTSAAEQVIIDGRLQAMTSRQTRLRDRYLPSNPEQPRAYLKP